MASSPRPDEQDSQDDQPTIRESAPDSTAPRATAGTAAAPAPAVSADHAEDTTRIPAHSETGTTSNDVETTRDQPETTIDRPAPDDPLDARREAAEQLGVAKSRNRTSTDIGLLILRVMNIVMVLHGVGKATDYSAFRQTVASNSFGALAPDLFAIMVTAGQLVLPIAIALGFLTRIAGLLQAIMMAVIWVLFPLAAGLINPDTGGINGESAYLFVAVGLTLFFTGAGRISLDQVIFGKGGERRAARRAAKKVS